MSLLPCGSLCAVSPKKDIFDLLAAPTETQPASNTQDAKASIDSPREEPDANQVPWKWLVLVGVALAAIATIVWGIASLAVRTPKSAKGTTIAPPRHVKPQTQTSRPPSHSRWTITTGVLVAAVLVRTAWCGLLLGMHQATINAGALADLAWWSGLAGEMIGLGLLCLMLVSCVRSFIYQIGQWHREVRTFGVVLRMVLAAPAALVLGLFLLIWIFRW
jgi:hypothetical protein